MSTVSQISIRILDKEYQVACPPEERAALMRSAELVNNKMREIRDSGRVIGLDRIAVMAALNIANDLVSEQARDDQLDDGLFDRLRSLRKSIDMAMTDNKQLEL